MKKLFFILFLFPILCAAQEFSDDEKRAIVNQQLEFIAQQNENSNLDYTTLYDFYLNLLDYPLDLNHLSREDLENLNVLSPLQVSNFLSYRSKYGQIYTLYELSAIPLWDFELIKALLPFFTVNGSLEEDISLVEMFSDSRHQIITRWQRTLEYQTAYENPGDSALAASPSSFALGSKDKFFSRYRMQYRDKMSIGLTTEKDAGEEFFRGGKAEFFSGHFYVKDQGVLKKFALGDYQLQFGQGLAIWSGLAFGKSNNLNNIKRNGNGIRPYSSVNENLFLRGSAATFKLGHFEVTGFYSRNRIDGSLQEDTNSIDFINVSSLPEDGFHRTLTEYRKKDAVLFSNYGAHIDWKHEHFVIGLSAIESTLDVPFQEGKQLYQRFNFVGSKQQNIAMDYRAHVAGVSFFGESAYDLDGYWAHTHGLLADLDGKTQALVQYRNFDKQYHGLLSNAIGEGSTVSNEQGLMLGLQTKIATGLDLSVYFDSYGFQWLGFRRDAPSKGYDVVGQINYSPSSKVLMYFRFKNEQKGINRDEESVVPQLDVAHRQNFRLHSDFDLSSSLSLRVRGEVSFYKEDKESGTKEYNKGQLFFTDLIYRFERFPLKISSRYAIFNTFDYDTRIYAYENDVLYAFSIPAYAGNGTKTYLMLQYKWRNKLDIWLRYAQSYFPNDYVQSSGINEVNANTLSELKLQVRWTF
jgi:hypothetical protein